MVKVVKSCNEWSGERLGPALEAFTSRRDYPLAGQLILILPEGRGMDAMTSGSPSDLESRPSHQQASQHC